jgi:hypothetical protein
MEVSFLPAIVPLPEKLQVCRIPMPPHHYLHPAQLEARQEEQPEEVERTAPSPARVRAEKPEKSLSTFLDWQAGQATDSSAPAPRTSCSKTRSHFRHSYSKIGTPTSILAASDP